MRGGFSSRQGIFVSVNHSICGKEVGKTRRREEGIIE